MSDMTMADYRQRLSMLGARIDAKIAEFHRQGALHGAERKAAAEWKLGHLELAGKTDAGGRTLNQLQRELEVLRLSFERWLAQIDETRPGGQPEPGSTNTTHRQRNK